jgi:flagella synthesis protein FlgN
MAAAAEFLPTVAAEVAIVQVFVELLEREQQMLVKGEVNDLLALVGQKNALAAQLAGLAAQRGTWLAAEGRAADRSGVTAWLADHPSESDAGAAWSLLLSLASQARELNRVNGALIQLRMHHNAQALEVLLGGNGALALYGPDGQNAAPSGRRISDRA